MRILLMSLFAIGLSSSALAYDPLDVYGTWLTANGDAHVEIADCGDGTPCGKMVWVQPPEGVEVPVDANNPDPALQSRPLIGLQMLWDFDRKKNRWKNGKIYNGEDGKTYKSHIKLAEDGTLEVEGCVLFLCQEQIWTRLPEDAASAQP